MNRSNRSFLTLQIGHISGVVRGAEIPAYSAAPDWKRQGLERTAGDGLQGTFFAAL